MSNIDITITPLQAFRPTRERLIEDLICQIENEDFGTGADWSGWVIENIDFVELTKEVQRELCARHPEDERFQSDGFHEVIVGGITACGALFCHCNLDYLCFLGADFSDAVFEDCQQRGFFQARFNLRNATLMAPHLTLDTGVIFHDLGALKKVSGEVFHVGDGRIVHGVKFDSLRQIVYRPTLKDRWDNARQFLNAAREYETFQQCTGLLGRSLSGLIGNLRAHIVQGLRDHGYEVKVQDCDGQRSDVDKNRLDGPR